MNLKKSKSDYVNEFCEHITSYKNYSSLTIESNSNQSFSFKKENYLDKFFKLLGFSKEFQLENSNFNQQIYIVSDSKLFYKDLSNSQELQSLIMELFSLGIRTIESDGKKLFVTFEKTPKAYKKDEDGYKYQLTTILTEINVILKQFHSSRAPIDPLINKWHKLKTYFTFFLAAGFINFIIDYGSYRDKLLYEGLFKDSLYYSISIFLACLVISTVKFFNTSRTHIIIITNLKLALPTFIIWVYFGMLYANVSFDHYGEKTIYSDVVSKLYYPTKRGMKYSVEVSNFDKENSTYTLASSKEIYNSIEAGSKIILTIKSGYLGYKWVEEEGISLKKS